MVVDNRIGALSSGGEEEMNVSVNDWIPEQKQQQRQETSPSSMSASSPQQNQKVDDTAAILATSSSSQQPDNNNNNNHHHHHADDTDTDDGTKEEENDQVNNPVRTTTTASSLSPPYTVFNKHQKRFVIFMSSWAGFFSPVSANIYYPALNTLSDDLGVSLTMINLTVTSYMIFQGLSPMFIGNFADAAGRRPAYIVGFLIYFLANIGLALQNNYAALFILRCVQSTGSSPTVALSFGVVADVTTSAERGVAMGFVAAGSLLGPSLGPIIGGLLSQYLGWRAIFWFLVIFSGVYIVLFLLAVPETGRKVVGNGSIPPQGWNMSIFDWLNARRRRKTEDNSLEERETLRAQRPPIRFPNPWSAIRICFEKEASLILIYNALVFSVFYQITTGISSQFKLIYGFNDLHIGLCYLPFGVGCSVAALLNGKLLDLNYRRLALKHNLPITKNKQQDLRNFPIETARLQILMPLLYTNCAFIIAYAWVLEYELPLAAPLILLFFVGYFSCGCTSVCNNFIVDLYPTMPATATAANNLLRCFLGAGATALVVPMIDSPLGRGWTYTLDALLLAAFSPMMWVLMKWGPKWREEKRVRDEKAALAKAAAKEARLAEEGAVLSRAGNEKREKA